MTRWIVAFLSGTLVGLAAGVLFAPSSGDRLRRKLARRSGQLATQASDIVETAGDQIARVRRALA